MMVAKNVVYYQLFKFYVSSHAGEGGTQCRVRGQPRLRPKDGAR